MVSVSTIEKSGSKNPFWEPMTFRYLKFIQCKIFVGMKNYPHSIDHLSIQDELETKKRILFIFLILLNCNCWFDLNLWIQIKELKGIWKLSDDDAFKSLKFLELYWWMLSNPMKPEKGQTALFYEHAESTHLNVFLYWQLLEKFQVMAI